MINIFNEYHPKILEKLRFFHFCAFFQSFEDSSIKICPIIFLVFQKLFHFFVFSVFFSVFLRFLQYKKCFFLKLSKVNFFYTFCFFFSYFEETMAQNDLIFFLKNLFLSKIFDKFQKFSFFLKLYINANFEIHDGYMRFKPKN